MARTIWVVMLAALVDGSFHFPTAQELASTDVVVMYKGDACCVLQDHVGAGAGHQGPRHGADAVLG